jgi:dTDP-4-amino-4,6-dideoxygalactose transaminase
MKVPFLDLKAQYRSIKDEIAVAMQRVLENTAFAGGPFVQQFEKEFAEFCHCQYGIGVGSGTEAIWAAIMGLDVGPGDEVITVSNTFIATVEAISFCGAKPVLVDINEQTYTLNPESIEQAISPRTKAVIPVHLYGQMADMDPIMEIARQHNIVVIEDACQAHGAEYKGKRAGSIGDAGCFSFYPGKNLGAFGEAGAIVTNNSDLDKKIRMFRDHGQQKKYHHTIIGWNARMDGLQAAILTVKLKHLPDWTEARRKNARTYNEFLSELDSIIIPKEMDYAKHVYHIYPIRIKNRNALIDYLTEKEVFTGIHYPVPIHLTKAYQSLEYTRGSLPVTEACADQLVSLPMFPELTHQQIEQVVSEINHFITMEM